MILAGRGAGLAIPNITDRHMAVKLVKYDQGPAQIDSARDGHPCDLVQTRVLRAASLHKIAAGSARAERRFLRVDHGTSERVAWVRQSKPWVSSALRCGGV